MISGLLFINQKGEIVISRYYRDDVNRAMADAFRMEVVLKKEDRSPVILLNNISYLYVRHANIYVVAMTKMNANAALVLQFLYSLVDVFKSYFGGVFDEQAIRVNFVLIYELLDETLDFGFPQMTGSESLKHVVLQEGTKMEIKQVEKGLTERVTGATPWRTPGIKYRKNEVYLDVIESVNLLMSSNNTVLRSDVSGQVVMKSFLSGIPECKFGLNDKIVMEREAAVSQRRRATPSIAIDDVTFHQCVKLGKFDSDRTISFIPPDGEFELMRYRVTELVNLPFRVFPIIKELGRTRLEVNIKLKSMFSVKLFATNVTLMMPVPKNTALCHITLSQGAGRAKYEAEKQSIVWRMKRFPGDSELSLSAEVEMLASTSTGKKWVRPPITMDFQVPMYTSSGLHVRFLKVFEKSNYQTTKWVRYITKAGQGTYQHRL